MRGQQQPAKNYPYVMAANSTATYQNKTGHNKNFSQTRRNIQAPKLDHFGDRQNFSALQSPTGQLGPQTVNRPTLTYESQLAGANQRLPTSPSHRMATLNRPKGIAGKKLS